MRRTRFPAFATLALSLLLAGCGLDTDALLDDIGLSGEAKVASPLAGGEETLPVGLVALEASSDEPVPLRTSAHMPPPSLSTYLMSDRRGGSPIAEDQPDVHDLQIVETLVQRSVTSPDARTAAMWRTLGEARLHADDDEAQDRVDDLIAMLDAKRTNAARWLEQPPAERQEQPLPRGFDTPFQRVPGGLDLGGIGVDQVLDELSEMRQVVTVRSLPWTGEDAADEVRVAALELDVIVVNVATREVLADLPATADLAEPVAYAWDDEAGAYLPSGDPIAFEVTFDEATARAVLAALKNDAELAVAYDLGLAVEGDAGTGALGLELGVGDATLSFD